MADLEADIAAELAADLKDEPAAQARGSYAHPLAFMPKTRTLKLADLPDPNAPSPERASEQLALAVKGLLQVEQELIAVATDIIGELPEQDAPGAPSEKGAMIPRLRSDAEVLARLAIRLHKLTEEIRSKL